jgi:Tol biopolymer transport system component
MIRIRFASLLAGIALLAACGQPVATSIPPTETLAPSQTIPATRTEAPTQTALPAATRAPSAAAWPMGQLGPIAYVKASTVEASYNEIFLIDGDGSNGRLLFSKAELDFDLDYVAGLSWSPDGKRLACATLGWADIYILSVESSTVRNITNTDNELETSPAWSPDGERIVFRYHSWDNGAQIRVMEADGSHVQTLVRCSTTRCDNPAWSPSGEIIAYEYGTDIYVMNPDGSGQRKLIGGGLNLYPAWSPDGQHIAFARSVGAGTTAYLYLANPDGTGLTPLTDDASNVARLSWSPDGQYIAFENIGARGQTGTLLILNVASAATKVLAASSSYAPAWRPGIIVNQADIRPLDDCTGGWTRLTAGQTTQVMGAAGDLPLRVRSEPLKGDNVIGQIQPGTIVQVLEGPVCADGLVFWKASSAAIPGGSGWIAEGDGTEYWLEPHNP